jgi:hypothetical protein
MSIWSNLRGGKDPRTNKPSTAPAPVDQKAPDLTQAPELEAPRADTFSDLQAEQNARRATERKERRQPPPSLRPEEGKSRTMVREAPEQKRRTDTSEKKDVGIAAVAREAQAKAAPATGYETIRSEPTPSAEQAPVAPAVTTGNQGIAAVADEIRSAQMVNPLANVPDGSQLDMSSGVLTTPSYFEGYEIDTKGDGLKAPANTDLNGEQRKALFDADQRYREAAGLKAAVPIETTKPTDRVLSAAEQFDLQAGAERSQLMHDFIKGDGPTEPYDPADHTVSEVLDYLKYVIVHNPREAVHVVKAELEGKGRKGIMNAKLLVVQRTKQEYESGTADEADVVETVASTVEVDDQGFAQRGLTDPMEGQTPDERVAEERNLRGEPPTRNEATPADAGEGGDGGTPPPTDQGPAEESVPEPRKKPRSKILQTIAENIARIQENLKNEFSLSGDHAIDVYNKVTKKNEKKIVHSDEVIAECKKTLAFFGRKPTLANKKMLFAAVQVYRGMSVDRKGLMFGGTQEEFNMDDAQFIQALHEMVNNTRTHNNPFAYNFVHYRMGGVERYPTVPSRELADWFTKPAGARPEDGAPVAELQVDVDTFIEMNIKQWNEIVYPRLHKMARADQREALLDMIDAVQVGLRNPDLKPRTLDSRVSAREAFDPSSEFAAFDNDQARLVEFEYERREQSKRADIEANKGRKRGELDSRGKGKKKKASDPLSASEANEDPTGFWSRLEHAGEATEALVRSGTNFARIIGVLGLPQIAMTGVAEKVIGVHYQKQGLGLLRFAAGPRLWDTEPTQDGIDEMAQHEHVTAVGEMIKMISAQGMAGLTDAAERGMVFTQGATRREGETGDIGGKLGKFKAGTDVVVGAAMEISTGDVVMKQATAQVFFDYLCYAFARDSKENGITMTPEMLATQLISDPNGFWYMVATTNQGREALLYAGNTSMGGIDPITDELRKLTSNCWSDAALGFVVGWYMKFGIRSAIRMVPFSNAAIYAVKTGVINPYLVASGHKTVEQIADSNQTMIGAHGVTSAMDAKFWSGLAQNTLVDLSRFGTQLAALSFCWGMVALFGGIQPPDDEDLWSLWYEWKIGGQAIKENWYWNELLGFAMPFVIGVMAGARDDVDMSLSSRIIFTGMWDKLANNPWNNIFELGSLITGFDKNLAEAQLRAEGYGDLTSQQYALTQVYMWAARRGYASVEPQIIRQIYNEHGLWTGQPDLAHSPNVVYDTSKVVEPGKVLPTMPTTYQDAQMRRTVMMSPMASFLMNLKTGFYTGGQQKGVTGYFRNQMPLISNADVVQQSWVEELSVIDPATGEYLPADTWTEEQKQTRVNAQIKLLSGKHPDPEGRIDPKTGKVLMVPNTASWLAAQGVVIPMDARVYARDYLWAWQNKLKKDMFYDDRNNGKWAKGNGHTYEQNMAAQDKAWNKMMKEVEKKDLLVEMLMSDEIPYSSTKYNRQEENFRTRYVWKSGEKTGQTADPWDFLLYQDQVELVRYAAGDLKSSFLPWLTVMNPDNAYNSQTGVQWQTPQTDLSAVQEMNQGRTVQNGMFEGENVWDLSSAGGKVGEGITGKAYDAQRLVYPQRGFWAVGQPYGDMPDRNKDATDLWTGDLGQDGKAVDWSKTTSSGGSGRLYYRGGGGGGWGSSDYAPKIYSHPAYSINPDKPAGLYSKNPSYVRFDYLRPKVFTKGSREAYRREDY